MSQCDLIVVVKQWAPKCLPFTHTSSSHGKWLVCRRNVLDVDDEVVRRHASVTATALLESVPFTPPPTEPLLYCCIVTMS